ncbi:hypothetical protein PvNV_017 [Penaeus vannamei nudivirus]|nr:hypothetical protein PvSNPV_017 [Penaeus vannamei nucleopolyhedrovirus]
MGPDSASVISNSIFGGEEKIPKDAWAYVDSKNVGVRDRRSKLVALTLKYHMHSSYYNVQDFIAKATKAIEVEDAISRDRSSKSMWCKYLALTKNLSLLCTLCADEKCAVYTNYRGFHNHMKIHAKTLEDSQYDLHAYTRYKNAFKKFNAKEMLRTTEEDLRRMLEKYDADELSDISNSQLTPPSSSASSSECGESTQNSDILTTINMDDLNAEELIPCDLTEESELLGGIISSIDFQNVVNDDNSDSSLPPTPESVDGAEDLSSVIEDFNNSEHINNTTNSQEKTKPTLGSETVSESTNSINKKKLFHKAAKKEPKPEYMVAANLPLRLGALAEQPYYLENLYDFENDSNITDLEFSHKSEIKQKKSKTVMKQQQQQHEKQRTKNNTKPKTEEVESDLQQQSTKKRKPPPAARRRIRRLEVVSSSSSEDETNLDGTHGDSETEVDEVTAKKPIKRKMIEKNKIPDDDDDDETDHEVILPRKKTRPKAVKFKTSTPKPRVVKTANSARKKRSLSPDDATPKDATPAKKARGGGRRNTVPKSNAVGKTADQRNTYISVALQKMMSEPDEVAKVLKSEEHEALLEKLLSIIDDACCPDTNKTKKQTRTENALTFKKFAQTFGKSKTNIANREALATLVSTKILVDFFSKKTGKVNNPYAPKVLERQLENFKNFIANQKSAETKSKVEEHMKHQYKDYDNVTLWKEQLKLFSKLKTVAEYDKQLKKLNKACGHIINVRPILAAMSDAKFQVKVSKSGTLCYDITQHPTPKKNESKVLKNLINQLTKGSVSNLKHLMGSSSNNYVAWFAEYNRLKNQLNVTNNIKWFLNHVTNTISDSDNPMNPMSKISKTVIAKNVQFFVDMIMVERHQVTDKTKVIFTEGFYQNLTICCMKFLYRLYDKVLFLFKVNPLRSQTPNESHVGLLSALFDNPTYDSVNFAPKSSLHSTYVNYMSRNISKARNGMSAFMSSDRIAGCLFHMRLISKRWNLKTLDDLKPLFESNNREIVDMIESKCTMDVYDNFRSILYIFLYNLVCNVLYERNFVNGYNVVTSKLITWDFFKTVIFDAKFYEYGSFVRDAIFSFPTMNFAKEGEADDTENFETKKDAWFEIVGKHKELLFTELFGAITTHPEMDDIEDYSPETIAAKRRSERDAAKARGEAVSDDEDEVGTGGLTDDDDAMVVPQDEDTSSTFLQEIS